MPLQSNVSPVMKGRRLGLAINGLIERFRRTDPDIADALGSTANQVNDLYRALMQPTVLEDLVITDPQGRKIIELNPLGFITVQDASGHQVVTLGDVVESPLAITAATAATPSVLTVPGNSYENGDTIQVLGALGTVFSTYRIVEDVGISGAGTFTTTDLSGTPIAGAGAYAGDATAERYYGGLLTETIAIGESFSNYKLRAFADGSLKIKNATIELQDGSGNEIILDPAGPSIISEDALGNSVVIHGSGISFASVAHPGASLAETFDTISLTNASGTSVVLIKSNAGVTNAGTIRLLNNGSTVSIQLDPSATDAISTTGGGNIRSAAKVISAGNVEAGAKVTSVGNVEAGAKVTSVTDVESGGTVNAVSGYKFNGTPGVTTNLAAGTSISLNTATIQYKDWAGTNQSISVVTGVALNLTVHQVLGGILTT